MIVAKSIEFDAAHLLSGYPGKCSSLHGHRWKVELAITGYPLMSGNHYRGYMVEDFTTLKKLLDRVVMQPFDHKFVNDLLPMPTAEVICAYIFTKMKEELGNKVAWVKVWETPDSYAMISEGEDYDVRFSQVPTTP